MKKIHLLIFLAGFFASLQSKSQCNPVIPDTAFVVSSDSTFDVGGWDAGNITPHDYLICSGRTLTYNVFSSFPIHFYVASGATLILKSCQISYVNLEPGGTFIVDTSANYLDPLVGEIHCDTNAVTMTDTFQLANHPPVYHCPGNAFDYSLFAGGNSPCGGAAGILSQEKKNPLVLYPNPTADEIFSQLPISGNGWSVKIWSTDGRLMFEGNVQAKFQLNIASWPAGYYWASFSSGERNLSTGFVKN